MVNTPSHFFKKSYLSFYCIAISIFFVFGSIDAWAQLAQPGPQHKAGEIPRIEESNLSRDSVLTELPTLERSQAVFLNYRADYYQSNEELLHHARIRYQREWQKFTLIASGLWAQRFGFTGQQYALQLLPKLTRSTYLELSGSYSTDDLFPQWSAGAKLVQGLLPWWELQGGYEYIQLPNQEMQVYHAGMGFYPGNWEILANGHYTEDGVGENYSYSGRIRYFGNRDGNYIGLEGGYGPTAAGIEFTRDRTRIDDQFLRLLFGVRLNPSWNLFGRFAYHQEQFRTEVSRDRMMGELGFEIKF
jgi:YaiO family outer membrane protein